MSASQITALVVAATAFLTAAAHLAGDISGWIDKFRKLPIQTAAQSGPPAPPSNVTVTGSAPPSA